MYDIRNEMRRWLNTEVGTVVFEYDGDGTWLRHEDPIWDPDETYIVDDKQSSLRMKIFENPKILIEKLTFYNNKKVWRRVPTSLNLDPKEEYRIYSKELKMKYEPIIECTLSTPEEAISDCSKVCYQATHKKNITKSLVKSGHLAVLRFAYATFNIKNISVPCHVQMLRSAHLSFLVKSLRYTGGSKHPVDAITPIGYSDDVNEVFVESFNQSILTYNKLIDLGVKKEDARAVLPTNTVTELNVSGNLQAWSDFIKLRVSTHAQLEIRTTAIEIWKQLQELYPLVFDIDKVVNGKTLNEWLESLQ